MRIRAFWLGTALLHVISMGVGCGPMVNVSTGTYPPFIQAAQRGDVAEADRLLRAGAMVAQPTIGNQTALHVAAAEGQEAMVTWLLAHEAPALAKDQNNQTPADLARARGKVGAAEIIDAYAELLRQENEAIGRGSTTELEPLLARDPRGYTVLHVVAQLGTPAAVEKTLRAGADVNARTTLGLTPLHKAVAGGKIDVARTLVAHGADVNARDVYNNGPLYYAINAGNSELVTLFLNAGADTSARSIFGNETALQFAERLGNPQIIELVRRKSGT